MLKLLKVFGRGVLTTVLLPFILLIWLFYGIFCIGLFIVMFVKGVIAFFKGDLASSDLPEDIEARRLLLEEEKKEEQAKLAMQAMYQSVVPTQPIQPSFNPLDPFDEELHEKQEEREEEENIDPLLDDDSGDDNND